jgi:hypothetical protein
MNGPDTTTCVSCVLTCLCVLNSYITRMQYICHVIIHLRSIFHLRSVYQPYILQRQLINIDNCFPSG